MICAEDTYRVTTKGSGMVAAARLGQTFALVLWPLSFGELQSELLSPGMPLNLRVKGTAWPTC
jgi:hypothetical protein